MRFGHIEHIILLGGSPLLGRLADELIKAGRYNVSCFSCERQLSEVITVDGKTLADVLKDVGIDVYTPDIS